MTTTITNRVPVTTPRVKADILATLRAEVTDTITAAHAACKAKGKAGMSGADLARVLVATGDLSPKGNFGLRLRSYARSHGAWVGNGGTYTMSIGEARRIAAGFIGKVAPPKGVRYAKGSRIATKAEGATDAEVASAA